LLAAVREAVEAAIAGGGVHTLSVIPARVNGGACPRCGTPMRRGTVGGPDDLVVPSRPAVNNPRRAGGRPGRMAAWTSTLAPGCRHRLTSYVPHRDWDKPVDDDPRVRHDLKPNDPDTVPPQLKSYPDTLPVVALPRDLPDPGQPATAVLAGVPARRDRSTRHKLGRVLFLGAASCAPPSATAAPCLPRQRFGRRALSPGGVREYARCDRRTRRRHWYDAEHHALVQVAPAAEGTVTTLIVTGVPWRTGWRYAERGWRHIYWDGGTLLSQLSAAASSAGWAPRLRTLFPDAAVTELVGADGVHEFPIALLSFVTASRPSDPPGRPRPVNSRRSSSRWPQPRNGPATATSSAIPGPTLTRYRTSRRRTPSTR